MSDSEKSGAQVAKERTRMVICAIDSLKGRKARPDETKICNFVERRFGLKKDETIAAIKEAVTEGSVLKVKYKDSVSYRNPLKFSSKMSNHVMSASSDSCVTPQNVKHILRELRALSRSVTDGVPLQSVVQSLHSKPYSVTYDQSLVDKVLIRAIEMGSVKQLPNGKYVLAVGKRIVARKADVDQSAQMTKSEDTDSHRLSDLHHPDHVSGELDLNEDSSHLSNSTTESSGVPKKNSSMTRERPASKRKKFKKSLGPDFIESSELGPQFMKDSFEPKCDLCQLRSKLNRKGDKEELLSCKDCNTKVHPSCMDYSEELAERSGRSPWQCMECKTCDICRDSKDGANMLVCDLCDKGFHMSCHMPAVAYKPSGKWVCAQCSPTDLKQRADSKKKNTVDDNQTTITDTEPNEELNGVTKGQNDNLEPIVVKANSESSSVSSLAFNLKEIYPEEISNPQKWSAEDVENYIRNIGFPEQSLLFKEQEIDGTSLLLLRRSDVLTGFHMKLGPALKIYSHIVRLQKND